MKGLCKYFDQDVFYAIQHVKSGLFQVKYIETSQNPADYFTKPHSAQRSDFFHRMLALVEERTQLCAAEKTRWAQ